MNPNKAESFTHSLAMHTKTVKLSAQKAETEKCTHLHSNSASIKPTNKLVSPHCSIPHTVYA